MTIRNSWRGALVLVLLATASAVAFQAAVAPKAAAPVAPAAAASLGGEERPLSFVSTDKPIYRTGETVYVRSVLLHQETHAPLSAAVQGMIEIKGPKGDVVAGGMAGSEDSVLGYSWTVPPEQAGGEYTVHVSYPHLGFAPADRKFDIRAYRAPRIKSQIKFLRDGYGPADEVAATLHAERAEGGSPKGAKVTVTARVDGGEAHRGQATLDDKGECLVRFKLPAEIRRGEGTLVLAIEDGGVVETASKTIPILLQTVDLTMFPEGGNLVAGVPNRVYLEAFTPAKKPADLAGVVVVAGSDKEVASFRTEHEGRGRLTFTPEAGQKYQLKINEPAGIKARFGLPEVQAAGVAMQAKFDVTIAAETVKLSLASPAAGKFTVTLKQREKTLATEKVELAAGKTQEIALPHGKADGVLVATVWDEKDKPLAERLVFVRPAQSVQVKITADHPQYVPGGKARLTIRTTDGQGAPVSAVVGVSVADDSVLEMIEKREQAPRLPVMVLLEGDVKELADAHVYLDDSNAKAPLATDLLLGTQGWRRFAFTTVEKFIADHGDAARRVLALRMASPAEIDALSDNFAFGGVGGGPGAPRGGAIPRPAAAALDASKADGKPLAEAGEAKGEDKAALAAPLAREGKEQEKAANRLEAAANEERQVAGAGLAPASAPEQPAPALRDALQAADAKASAKKIAGDRRFRQNARSELVAIRVYAHQVRENRKPGERKDFAETLFWAAGVKTSDKGEATVEFGLNDAVTSFRVFADAFTSSGSLGSGALKIDSVEPFYLEPKLPLEVTTGDKPRIPVSIVNASGGVLAGGKFAVAANTSAGINQGEITLGDLPAGVRQRKLLGVNVGRYSGNAEVTLSASAGPYADKVTRSFKVRPLGFPQELGKGGLLSPGETATVELTIPQSLVPRSLEAKINVYPTPLASMTEALERLIQEPCGCFEQTSSSTYPLVMAQQYFMSHQGVDPAIIERAGRTLETGYQRLIGFECKGGGFEWFGADPGHDALTAYGLMEFTEMSQVRSVDANMLERTRKWLLAQRDGKGGFARKTHTYHTWLAEPDLAFSYNTWALLEAGIREDLAKEIAFARQAGEKSPNTYVVALAANVLGLGGDKEGSDHLLDKLAGKQQENGSLKDASQSVVGSGGEALEIETTALAVMAWLKNPSYAPNVEKGIKYLADACKGGRYGSTQSTILALKAIVAYDKARAVPKAPGSLQLVIDGKKIGEPIKFTAESKGAIALPDATASLTPGAHKVQIVMEGGSQMPYTVAVKLFNLKPDNAEKCKLHLETKLRDAKVQEGTGTEVQVVVVNTQNEVVPTPMAIIGIPGGLEVRHDQLKELVKQGKIDAYEVLGREVVLYWRALEKEARVELPLSLIAAIPGTYTGPASRTYLYYTDEYKHWNDGLAVEILPKTE